ncbi:MAG: SDR family oxidoreductase [Myxococcota bacterium]|jgi:NAD(P)-dependent dehydrogenase (short-subunit alcohol dehydrogenase family)|nr:SDR family oxidoreductase [Myxococcota bacterium]
MAERGPSTGARTVVITGGAGGIGSALASAFGSNGARIALLDLDGERLEATTRALRADGIEVSAHQCDIRDRRQCDAAIEAVITDWGGVDVLVNNAGISHRSLFVDTDHEVIERVMGVNFFGAVHCTRAALPSLVARKGSVVVLSSIAGFAPLLGRTAYAASKHALEGFFSTLRTELEPQGVSVLVVCPGFTDTAMDTRALSGDGSEVGKSRRAVGGTLTPTRVADAIVAAVIARRHKIVLSPIGHISLWLTKVAPRVYERLMVRSQREEFFY